MTMFRLIYSQYAFFIYVEEDLGDKYRHKMPPSGQILVLQPSITIRPLKVIILAIPVANVLVHKEKK